jgi:hypothetical protein
MPWWCIITGMARNRKQPAGKNRKKDPPLTDTLPELLAAALAGSKDFILCFGTDEETGKKRVHVMTGQFITPCMLRKLAGQAESQRDEGATLQSREWE